MMETHNKIIELKLNTSKDWSSQYSTNIFTVPSGSCKSANDLGLIMLSRFSENLIKFSLKLVKLIEVCVNNLALDPRLECPVCGVARLSLCVRLEPRVRSSSTIDATDNKNVLNLVGGHSSVGQFFDNNHKPNGYIPQTSKRKTRGWIPALILWVFSNQGADVNELSLAWCIVVNIPPAITVPKWVDVM